MIELIYGFMTLILQMQKSLFHLKGTKKPNTY